MAIKIMCAHGFSPEQTPKSLAMLTAYIGPLEMRDDGKGGKWCPCGYKIPKSAVKGAPHDA